MLLDVDRLREAKQTSLMDLEGDALWNGLALALRHARPFADRNLYRSCGLRGPLDEEVGLFSILTDFIRRFGSTHFGE